MTISIKFLMRCTTSYVGTKPKWPKKNMAARLQVPRNLTDKYKSGLLLTLPWGDWAT